MSKFLLVYHGSPQFSSKEDGANHMVAWKAWNESLGAAVVDPGMPVGASKTITASGVEDGGGANPASGITILQAETMEAAIEMAQSCPHISAGGTIEVAEAIQLDM